MITHKAALILERGNMVTSEDVGSLVQYWKSGWRTGTLKEVVGTTAVIEHPTLKRDQKVHVDDCKLIEGGHKVGDTIFDNLLSVAATKGVGVQEAGESDDAYIRRILKAVHSVDDPLWNKLPIKAQQWFNEAATAASTAHPLPPCPGFVGRDQVQKTVETVTPPKGLPAKEAIKTQKPAKPAVVKPPLATEPPKRKREITGVMDALRRTVILHPDWSSRQIYDFLRLNGYPNAKIDTISVDGGNIKRVIELAKQMGFWIDKDADAKKNDATEVTKAS